MGWSFRKSYKAGPIRINISKSGIGYSIGTKGFRIGNGPRGRYVRMGAHGIYYYAKLKDPSDNQEENTEEFDNHSNDSLTEMNNDNTNLIKLETLTSDSCIGYLEAVVKYKQYVDDLNEKYNNQKSIAQKRRSEYEKKQNDEIKKIKDKFLNETWVFMIIPIIIACCFIPWYPYYACPVIPVLAVIYAIMEDNAIGSKVRKIEKDFKPKFRLLDQQEKKLDEKYNELLKSHGLIKNFTEQQIAFLDKLKTLFHNTNVEDEIVCMKPVNYGAYIPDECSKVHKVCFKDIDPNDLLHRSIPTIKIENRILYFFPQGLLIEENECFFEIGYEKIAISQYADSRTVEKHPKKDAEIVGTFWKHTRVDGTPDRRYKDNPQFFVVNYSGVQIHSNSLLASPIYFSKKGCSENFINELTTLIRTAPISPRIL